MFFKKKKKECDIEELNELSRIKEPFINYIDIHYIKDGKEESDEFFIDEEDVDDYLRCYEKGSFFIIDNYRHMDNELACWYYPVKDIKFISVVYDTKLRYL